MVASDGDAATYIHKISIPALDCTLGENGGTKGEAWGEYVEKVENLSGAESPTTQRWHGVWFVFGEGEVVGQET